jgi:hypothetical protein
MEAVATRAANWMQADLFGVRAIEPEILAREAEAERAARTKPLVVTLGSSAHVQLQASRTLEAMAQQPGSEADSTRVSGDQKHRNMGLNEAIGLDLDRTDEMPTGSRDQRRHARRGQCAAGPLDIVRVFGPALRSHECDQPVEVG